MGDVQAAGEQGTGQGAGTAARVALVGDDAAHPATPILERVRGATGRTPNLYRALANAPELLGGWIDFYWRLRADCTTSRGLRELVILRVAQLTDAPYEWAAHYGMATAEGITDRTLAELADWQASDAFTPAERAALAMADELTDTGDLSDATWAALRPFVDDREAVELVLTVAGYACVSRTLLALRVPMEPAMLAQPPLPRPAARVQRDANR